jgi:hypothetical protein
MAAHVTPSPDKATPNHSGRTPRNVLRASTAFAAAPESASDQLQREAAAKRAERIRRARARANAVTYLIASIATTASLVGMWPVTRAAVIAAGIPEELVAPVALTVLGLLEGTIVACGIRARANVLESGETGVDGLGLWVAVGASSLVSATEASVAAPPGTAPGQQFVTVMVRLAAPIVAGWLWERGLAPERRADPVERSGILAAYVARLRAHLLSRAGNADADEISRRRAATRASRLTDRLLGSDEQHLTLRQRWTLCRLRKAIRASGAAHDPDARRYLMEDIAASRNAFALSRITPPSPWGPSQAVTGPSDGMNSPINHRRTRTVSGSVLEKRIAAESPENSPESPARRGAGSLFPTGREAYSAEELDITRRLFTESAERSGTEPSVNAVARAIARRWERAKRVHDAVRAERSG